MSEGPLLAIKTHALGDLLLVTPALHRLRVGCGNRRVVVATTEACAPLLARNPDVDAVVSLPDLGVRSALKALHALRHEAPREAVVFQVSRQAVLLARASGARRVTSLRDIGDSWPPPFDRYTADAYVELADLVAGPHATAHHPRLFVTSQERECARALTGAASYAVVAAGGGRNPRQTVEAKKWRPERWAALADHLVQTGLSVVLVGAGSDAATLAEIEAQTRAPVRNLAGKTDLRTLAAVVAEAALVVSIDSVALHMAVALDRPLVGIFGPTSRENFLPPGREHQVGISSPVVCSPCYGNGLFPGCRVGLPVCMAAIGVDEVLCATRRVLG